MRIVIDMQAVQREWGHGHADAKPWASLVGALVRNSGEHELILAMSGRMLDTVEPIRAAFARALPRTSIRVWHAPAVEAVEGGPLATWGKEVAAIIREAFLATLRPDVVYVPAFLDEGGELVTTFGALGAELPIAVGVEYTPLVAAALSGGRADAPMLEQLDRARVCHFVGAEAIAGELAARLPAGRVIVANAHDDASGWDAEARALLDCLERIARPHPFDGAVPRPDTPRPRLAYVSPLPPERTGIADYSADLIPALARYYDIEIVAAQSEVSDRWVAENCTLRSVEWLRLNANRMDRVLYHFGNSHFHQYMFQLIEDVPGVVVLHDFYLGHVHAYREVCLGVPSWSYELYHSHGYAAVRERIRDQEAAMWRYPANFGVFRHAKGVIVHGESSRALARDWYGEAFADDMKVIPLLRHRPEAIDRHAARKSLGIARERFVVCSFGLLGPSKLNRRLLDAWLSSSLAADEQCELVFVGQNDGGEYGEALLATIRASGCAKRVRITGWADSATFRAYLAAADVAVQLRALSRGETSAAVLDCMGYGLPTIVNANGSFAELPPDAVWMLPDEFSDPLLVEALEKLRRDEQRRASLGQRARDEIAVRHAPEACARQYFDAIESFYRNTADDLAIVEAIAALDAPAVADEILVSTASAVARTLPGREPARHLYLDVSATCRTDLKTGIERVARALTLALIERPPAGFRVEPVYLSDRGGVWHYRHARHYAFGVLGCPAAGLQDEPVQPGRNDIVLGLDLSGEILVQAHRAGLFQSLRADGAVVRFVVFDLLPLTLPHTFPPGADDAHRRWLRAVADMDGAICISRSVAEELRRWIALEGGGGRRDYRIDWFHLGADIENSAPSGGLPPDADMVLAQCAARPTFLMVGTIEPRKGHQLVIDAFERLWEQGADVNLLIVGKEGWRDLPSAMRRTIPQIAGLLRTHPEAGRRSLWLEGVSDAYLERLYAACDCLIAASEGEGFGLPLIEAAQHGLAIVARDIPVFREVAGSYAYYFREDRPDGLACELREWLDLHAHGRHPQSEGMRWLTWKDSASTLVSIVTDERPALTEVVQPAAEEIETARRLANC